MTKNIYVDVDVNNKHFLLWFCCFPGVPLVFELDKNFKPIAHPDAIAPLSARYLGDVSGIRARIEAVKAQTK